jgi:hypothetical protein
MRKPLLRFGLASLCFSIWLILSLAGCSTTALNPLVPDPPTEPEKPAEAEALADELRPNSTLSPEQVVKIQVEALQNNDDMDKGIELTFRFASPAHKQMTGPLNRFVRLVKNPAYRPMLNHRNAEYAPIKVSGNTATQRVTITAADGKAVVYIFELSKQDLPDCEGCWMTDSVILLPTKPQELKEI